MFTIVAPGFGIANGGRDIHLTDKPLRCALKAEDQLAQDREIVRSFASVVLLTA